MRRRGFLALPFLAVAARAMSKAAAAVRRRFHTAWIGGSTPTHTTIAEALRDIEPGGTIYVLPGYTETFRDPIALPSKGLSIVGMGVGEQRPELTFDEDSEA